MPRPLAIVSGDSNEPLAKAICQSLDEPLRNVFRHTFPSGEKYCQYKDNIRGRDVFIVQSMNSPVNDNLIQLLVMVDAAKRASADRVTAVVPYFGYLRQDRKNKGRTPISARLVADIMETAGINRVISMDFHCQQAQGFFSKDVPVDHLFSMSVFAEKLKEGGADVIVSPDTGGIKRATAFAKIMKANFAFINKERMGDEQVEMDSVSGASIEGKRVLIIDDMTESAGTLIEAAKVCRKFGAEHIKCAVTHGVFTDIGYERLINQKHDIDELITTDTVAFDNSKLNATVVSVAKIFGQAIRYTNTNRSITKLFQIDGF